MNLDTLALFLTVCRLGNFAAAAREHDLDPSVVSRLIAGLETDLAVRLFHRTTRHVTLTEAGERYRERVEPLVGELQQAQAEASSFTATPKGTLRLTASVALGVKRVVPLLPDFRARYPTLKVECLFTDSNLDLVAERTDLALRLSPAIEGDVIALKLMDTRYKVVASPEYLKWHPITMDPLCLEQHRCLLLSLRAFRTRWIFRDAKGMHTEVPVDGDIILSTPLALQEAALAGLGVALLPDWLVARDIAAGRLVNAFPAFEVTATHFSTAAWAVYPNRTFLPQKVRVAVDFFRDAWRK